MGATLIKIDDFIAERPFDPPLNPLPAREGKKLD